MGKKKTVSVSASVVASQEVALPKKNKPDRLRKQKKTRGKAYQAARSQYLHAKSFPLSEAIKLIKQLSYEKFNASVELHLNLTETGIKGEVTLPHGTGKSLKIAVFNEQIEKELGKNQVSFDILVAQTKDMPKLIKFAKLLGPKGLMPSPKRGTLTDDPESAVAKLESGVVHYKTEAKFPLLHQVIGKRDFTQKQLEENLRVFLEAVNSKFIQAAFIKSTMGPAIKLDLQTLT